MSIDPSTNTSYPSWDSIKSHAKSTAKAALAAAVAITPVYNFFANKSALQLGEKLPQLTLMEKVKGGVKLAPSVGVVVGSQMGLQKIVENALNDGQEEKTLANSLKSAAIVGTLTSPAVATFNGKIRKMPLAKIGQSLKSPAMIGAVALQETAFVGGISAADKVIVELKKQLGDNPLVNCMGAFTSGSLGSLAGHPANTAITRWQEGKEVCLNPKQLMRGASHKAIGTGIFAVIYTLAKNALNQE
jgi:hypothetical protein